MKAKERTDNKKLEKRNKELEKELEIAQMKIVGLNMMIDIAEQEYKLEIRKKSGPNSLSAWLNNCNTSMLSNCNCLLINSG